MQVISVEIPLMTTASEWLEKFATQLGIEPPSEHTIATLLDLAGVAAHSSERTAAPIACFMVGLAGLDPTVALDAARRV
jgi:hypothetical protein